MLIPDVQTGWDLILIARQPLLDATFEQLKAAILNLLRRADLLRFTNAS
jgi:ribonuclease P protein component